MSLGSNEALKHAVAAGLGLSVISRLAITQADDAARLKLVELKVGGFPLQRRWQVVWRKDHPLTAAARTFVQYLQSKPSL